MSLCNQAKKNRPKIITVGFKAKTILKAQQEFQSKQPSDK
jgi:hypothetical protein